MDDVVLAFSFTLLAGLATGVGSLLAFLGRPTDRRFLSVTLGFSAGVMVYVSFVEILPKARDSLVVAFDDETRASWWATVAFFGGILVIALLDRTVGHDHGNPHEIHDPSEMDEDDEIRRHDLLRMGLVTAVAISIHNFPEGLATFLATLEDPSLGVAIAIAIAIHNTPEGIAVAIPIYHATGNRAKAFWYSFASGLAEFLGAVIGYVVLREFFSDMLFGIVFAGIGGVMVFISLDQLLPAAQKYGEHHLAVYGLVAGMAVMATSLLLLA